MESHTSQEKLTSLEAGLIHPPTSSFRRPRKSHGCTKRILIYLATVLLVVVGYEIWQSVHTDYIMQKIEDGQRALPLEPETTKLQEMAEELKRVQLVLKEMQEKMDQRPQVIPETTEFPKPTAITESIADETTEDWKRERLASDLEKSSNDDAETSSSDSEIPTGTEAPEVTIEEELIQDPVFEPIASLSKIHRTESGWRFKFYFNFGQAAENETGPSEEVDIIETEVGVPTEAKDVTSDEQSKGYMDKLSDMMNIDWGLGWGSRDEEQDNEEQENVDSVEIHGTTGTSVDDYDDLYYDDHTEYDNYESYEYASSLKPGDYGIVETEENEDSTTTSPKIALGDTTTESVPVSTSDEPLGLSTNRDEPLLKKDDVDPGSQQPESIDESVLASSPSTQTASEERESLHKMIEGLVENHSLSMDKVWAKLEEVEALKEHNRQLASSDTKDLSYISKRSIETTSNEGPRKLISSEQLARKLAIIEQAVDDENHILQNEITVASEPAKSILQQKLNNFYKKMEAVSAHIDRLHQRYLKVNKLDDDYVSREFPSDEENH